MISVKSGRRKKSPVYKLRDRPAFESFARDMPFGIIVVYNYMCPHCESYLKQFKKLAAEYQKDPNLSFAKIHVQLEWMIRQAELVGDVTEENTFLRELDIGTKVPVTLFYRNGEMIWKLDGVLPPAIFRGLIKKLTDLSDGDGDR